MPTTDKARIARTITDLGYAPITAIDDNGKPTYGEVIWLPHHRAGGREYDAQPTGSASSVWADGREVYSYEDNQGYNNTLTTVGVTDDVEEDWYGHVVAEDGSIEEYSDGKEYPRFALIIIEDTTDGIGKTTIYYNSHIIQRSAQSGATSEGNGLNPQFPQHSIAHRPRLDCMCVKKEIPAKTKITQIPEPSAATPHIRLAEKTASVEVGKTIALTIDSIYPAGTTVSWTSGTSAKAGVTPDGVVSGTAAGNSVITASITVGGKSYTDTCNVTVTGS